MKMFATETRCRGGAQTRVETASARARDSADRQAADAAPAYIGDRPVRTGRLAVRRMGRGQRIGAERRGSPPRRDRAIATPPAPAPPQPHQPVHRQRRHRRLPPAGPPPPAASASPESWSAWPAERASAPPRPGRATPDRRSGGTAAPAPPPSRRCRPGWRCRRRCAGGSAARRRRRRRWCRTRHARRRTHPARRPPAGSRRPHRMRVAGGLVQRQRGAGHRGLVVDQPRRGHPAEPPGMLRRRRRLSVMLARMKSNASRARSSQSGCPNTAGGARQGGDGQAVPVGQHLVVPARADPLRPRLEQHLARPGQRGFLVRRAGRRDAAEDGVAFPVAARRHVVGALERRPRPAPSSASISASVQT